MLRVLNTYLTYTETDIQGLGLNLALNPGVGKAIVQQSAERTNRYRGSSAHPDHLSISNRYLGRYLHAGLLPDYLTGLI